MVTARKAAMEPIESVCARFPDDEILRRVRESVTSPATLKTYMLAARRALACLRAPERGIGLCRVLLTPESSFDELHDALRKDGRSPATVSTTVGSLMGLMKHAGLKLDGSAGGKFARANAAWIRILERHNRAAAKARLASAAAARDPASRLAWMTVFKKNEELAEAAAKAPPAERAHAVRLALLSSIYTDLDPRRQSDYWRLYVLAAAVNRARAEREPAYVDVTPATLRRNKGVAQIHIREYKTAKRYGEFDIPLPKRTSDLLLRSLELEPREYVFTGSDGLPFKSAHAFAKMHNRHVAGWFGAGVVNRHLRHARATAVQGDPLLSYAEREGRVANMAHSMCVSGRVYATGPKPVVRKDGSFDLVTEGATGRPEEYVCVPKRALLRNGGSRRGAPPA